MTTNTTTRRAVLAGTASLPALALALPAAAETDDPAVAAFRAWLSIFEARQAYSTPGGVDWDEDGGALALDDEVRARFDAMAETPPTTAAGLALILAAALYDSHGVARGCRFNDAESWFCDPIEERHSEERLITALWTSPAAELLRRAGT